MRYAYVENVKTEAAKGLRGVCQCCGAEVVPKCGKFKIHHWAHKSKDTCDPWWENESEWHRKWKNHFPRECQEVVFKAAQTQEKHIADVYSPKGWVIEFQSYSIDPNEVAARENFYAQMIWVVNGVKNEFDKIYFDMSIYAPHTNDPTLRNIKWVGRSKLLAKWTNATKHVYFDFGTDFVWHLINYDGATKKGQVKAYPKQNFVEDFGGKYIT